MLRKTAVVIGDALIDEIETPDRSDDYVGGAGLNVAVGLARLGVRATLIAAIGDDQDGQAIRAFLKAHNVQLLATISDLGTSRAVSQRLNGEPRYSFNPAAIRREIHLGEAERQALDTAAMVVISSFPFDNPGQVAQLEEAITDPGKRLVVDPNPRPGLLRDAKAFGANFERIAAHSLLAKISDEDAALLGAEDLTSMADALILAGAGHVLATAGPLGASISTADGVRLSQPVALLPGPVIDTMGAGDATLASTVKALMQEDAPDTSLFWADLLSAAMAVAAATCRSHGALLQIPATAVA
jgi:fructokinase